MSQGGSLADFVSAVPGNQVQFQIVVTSNGTGTANNVVVTDTLPGSFTLISGNTVTSLGNMTAGSSQTILLTGNLASEGGFNCGLNTLVNTAQASSSNTAFVSDTASVGVTRAIGSCVVVPGNPSISLTKEVRNLSSNNAFSSFTNANNNDTVQFRLTVRNTSATVTANNVRVYDTLPAGLVYAGVFTSDGPVSGNLFAGGAFVGTLQPGQTRVMTFNAVVSSSFAQTLTNTAQTTADNTGTVNAQAQVIVGSVAGSNVNLVLTKRAFNQTRNLDATAVTAQPGDIIIYTLSVQNTGNAAATGYVFQDNISDVLKLSMLQSFGDAAFEQGLLSLRWPAVTIPAGSTVEKTFTVKVNTTFASDTDSVMTNPFGNTLNILVNKPAVLGAFVAPKTGSTTTVAWMLATMSLIGFVAYKKKDQLVGLMQSIRQS